MRVSQEKAAGKAKNQTQTPKLTYKSWVQCRAPTALWMWGQEGPWGLLNGQVRQIVTLRVPWKTLSQKPRYRITKEDTNFWPTHICMYMYRRVHILIYTCTHIHILMHTYSHVHTHSCTHTCTHTHVYTHVYKHTCTRRHVYILMQANPHIHKHAHTHVNTTWELG